MNIFQKALFVIFCFSLSFSYTMDRRFSSTAPKRHEKMRKHFQLHSEKKIEEELPWTQKPYLTGDWKGERTKLSDKGYTFSGTYAADMLGNPTGGVDQGFAFCGSMGVDANIDFTKPLNLTGWHFYVSFVWRIGTNLTDDKIKNQFNVAQLYGGQTWKLNNLYIRKESQDKNFAFKIGRLEQGNDFLHSLLYLHYVNNAFCGNPVSVFLNTPFFAYPNSTWGAYFEYKPHPRIKGQAGIYNANKSVSQNKYHGFNFTFKSGKEGVLLITQWSYLNNFDSKGYKGNYSVGAFYVTGKTTESPLEQKNGDWMIYTMIDQMIYRKGESDSTKGVTPFIALLFAPQKDRNLFPFFFTTGIVFDGIIPTRDDDVFVLGAAYGKYSTDLRDFQQMQRALGFNVYPEDAETVLEANYRIQVTPWFYFQPDFQYIIKPKGIDSISDAFVLGAQTGIVF